MKETKNISSVAIKKAVEILKGGDWIDNYQFRHSEFFYLRKPTVKANKTTSKIDFSFTLEYKTKSHRVINDVCWSYSYNNITNLENDMEKLEIEILTKTSDPDRADQVFGKTFRKQLFIDRNYESLGWVIKK